MREDYPEESTTSEKIQRDFAVLREAGYRKPAALPAAAARLHPNFGWRSSATAARHALALASQQLALYRVVSHLGICP